jgi:signal transduction histidine kinase
VKLTLIFVGVMAVLLFGLSLFQYLYFRSNLDASINQALRARASEAVAGVRLGQPIAAAESRPLRDQGEAFVQVLDRRGRILDTSAGLGHRPLLSASELARSFAHPVLVERHESSRLFATPARTDAVVVVGVSLAQREKALETLNAVLLIGGPVALILASVIGYALAAGALRPVERMRARAATISSGELDARLPLPESIDEIYRLGSTLNEMLARVEHGVERERAFVTDASHELRTPLAVLKAELEVALHPDGSPGDMRAAVASAVEEADRVITVAEDLLVLARAHDTGLQLTTQTLDVDALLDDLTRRFGTSATRVGRRLVAQPAPGVRLTADPLRVAQALDNLVDNALRHAQGTVTISVVTARAGVELHVTDEGAGFPPEFLDSAFERFTRADPARARGGAGLGLAIADAIAIAHGGHAAAANRAEGGADVWLTLPYRAHES